MRKRILLAAGMAALAGLALSAISVTKAQQQVPMFSSGTNIVPLYVTVTDGNDRLVANLRQEDFAIFDDEVPQEIVVFRNDVQPISVVVMLDTSASMTAKLNLLMAGAEQFLIRLLPGDQGRVGAFNDKIELSPEFTGDRDRLVAELGELDFGNPTRLYDAIDASLDALAGIEGRRVVLVFTDGDDTGSDADDDDVLDRAIAEEVMIYAIGLRAEFFNGARMVTSRPDRGLRKFAQETGGGYFELSRDDELGSTFTRVAQELHSQYVIGFTPAALDGELHA
ncbi:MAG: VWA domain-containing protein, partial [Vicinamibacterales bacterium]|nr:VWA domain-containing protein [Vicinamibacterales bacterium]